MTQGSPSGWVRSALRLWVTVLVVVGVAPAALAAKPPPKPQPTEVTWDGSGAILNGETWEPQKSVCYGDGRYLEFLLSGTKSTAATITIEGGPADAPMVIVGPQKRTNTFRYLWEPASWVDLGALIGNVTASYDVAGTPRFTLSSGCLGAIGPPPSQATFVAAGNGHTCALLSDSTVQCWGRNHYGQLGDGSNTDSTTPVAVSNLDTATQIELGVWVSCALLSDYTVRCWGSNADGQLGNGTSTSSNVPVTVLDSTGQFNLIATQVVTGGDHTCAVLSDSTVQCWGSDSYDALGCGGCGDSDLPIAVSNLDTATQVDASEGHTCAVLSDSTVQCWGSNYSGELGDGSTTDSNVPVSVFADANESSLLENVAQVATGEGYTCAVLSDLTLKCWGNFRGINSRTPVTVPNLTGVTQVAAGKNHLCALLSDSTVQCWGSNYSGQLGNGTTDSSNVPVPVSNLNTATQVTVGDNHTCAVLSDSTVQCWGSNYYGQLGNGSTTNSNVPVAVQGFGP